jgi:hypothetical protein
LVSLFISFIPVYTVFQSEDRKTSCQFVDSEEAKKEKKETFVEVELDEKGANVSIELKFG